MTKVENNERFANLMAELKRMVIKKGHYKYNARNAKKRICDYQEMKKKYGVYSDEFEYFCGTLQDVIFKGEDGKVGLMSLNQKVLIPTIFDKIPEVNYDYCCDDEYTCKTRCTIVVKDGKYGLYNKLPRRRNKNEFTAECKYDLIFRLYDHYGEYYVCKKDGKKGLLQAGHHNKELFPCVLDDLYFQLYSRDGTIIVRKGHKFGLCYNSVCTDIIYDEVELTGQRPMRVRLGDDWYWLNKFGKETTNEEEASFYQVGY